MNNPEPKLRILVVDDEDAVREVVCWMLQEAGHDVHQAVDGQSALDFLADSGRMDLVISDINMPGIDGLELAKVARQRWPGLPVLLISGRPPPSGARPFIPKPFRWATLAAAVTALAGGGGGGWGARLAAD